MTEIKIAFPPNYEEIKKHFDIENENVVFTYGNAIYNPKDLKLPNDLIVHEEVHIRQQGNKPTEWWMKYLNDKDFRLSQEVEAYIEQYKYVKSLNIPTKIKEHFLEEISQILSSKIYGNIINYHQAHAIIRRGAKI